MYQMYQAYEQLWSAQVKTSLHRLPLDLWSGSKLESKCLNGRVMIGGNFFYGIVFPKRSA